MRTQVKKQKNPSKDSKEYKTIIRDLTKFLLMETKRIKQKKYNLQNKQNCKQNLPVARNKQHQPEFITR